MSTGSRIVTVVAALALAAGAGLVASQRQSAANVPAPKAPAPRGVPVTVATVERTSVPLSLQLVGRTESYSTVTLKPRIDGLIVGVHYQAGQHVKRGQKMVSLDARAIEAQVRQNDANLARDRAQLAKARADLARYTDLVSRGFVSAAQLDTFKATVDSLEATVAADQAALELTRVQLSYTSVIAPMDGVAGAVLVFPGGSVKANETNLVVINQVRPMYVTFSVPEGRLPEIGRGGATMRVDVRVPGAASAKTGELSFVDNTVDPATGTIVMKAKLANQDEQLTPGQFVEVAIRLKELPDAIVMPAEALQTGPEGTFVYVARPDQTVEVRRVATRSLGNQKLLVDSGLQPGEQVVTDGQLRLAPGARFEVRDAPRRAQAGSDAPGGAAARADGLGGERASDAARGPAK